MKTASEKFADAALGITRDAPQYINFWGLLSFKPTTNEKVTLRTNMKDDIHAIIEYNEKFIDRLSSESVEVLLCIELNRLLLRHSTKRVLPDAKKHYDSSTIVAADPSVVGLYNTNQETVALANRMPTDANPDVRQRLPQSYNPVTDKFLERLYKLLDSEEQASNGGQQSNQQNGSSRQPKLTHSQNNNKLNQQQQDEADALQQHFNNAVNNIEKWDEGNDLANAEIASAVRGCDASSWGNMPANLRNAIMAANAQVIDPRKALKNFIATAYSNNTVPTRMKTPRRYPELIGKMPGFRHTQEHKILIAVDASGSMSQDDISLACKCVNDFVRTGTKVDFCWWDYVCTEPAKALRYNKQYDVCGGGGTDPECVMRYVREHKLKYDGLVFITDNGFYWDKPKEFKQIFIIETPDARDAPEWVKNRKMRMQDVKQVMAMKR